MIRLLEEGESKGRGRVAGRGISEMPGKREGKKRGRIIPLLVKFRLEMVSSTKLLRDPLDPVKPTHAVPVQ